MYSKTPFSPLFLGICSELPIIQTHYNSDVFIPISLVGDSLEGSSYPESTVVRRQHNTLNTNQITVLFNFQFTSLTTLL